MKHDEILDELMEEITMHNTVLHITECGNFKRFATDSNGDGLQSLDDILSTLSDKELLEQDADYDARESGHIRRNLRPHDFIVVGGSHTGNYWVIPDPGDYIDVVRRTYPLYNLTLQDQRYKHDKLSKIIILNPYLATDNLVIWAERNLLVHNWVVYHLDVNNEELPELLAQMYDLIGKTDDE